MCWLHSSNIAKLWTLRHPHPGNVGLIDPTITRHRGHALEFVGDGMLIQAATTEAILAELGGHNVADFVAGISRSEAVHAHTMMDPIKAYRVQIGAGLKMRCTRRILVTSGSKKEGHNV